MLQLNEWSILVGGQFNIVGNGNTALNLARLGCPELHCYADCDFSGTLDFFDFLCFQTGFADGFLVADCDGSGAVNLVDFLCFQNAFAAGCP